MRLYARRTSAPAMKVLNFVEFLEFAVSFLGAEFARARSVARGSWRMPSRTYLIAPDAPEAQSLGVRIARKIHEAVRPVMQDRLNQYGVAAGFEPATFGF